MAISNTVKALEVQGFLSWADQSMPISLQRLSTGRRINAAADAAPFFYSFFSSSRIPKMPIKFNKQKVHLRSNSI